MHNVRVAIRPLAGSGDTARRCSAWRWQQRAQPLRTLVTKVRSIVLVCVTVDVSALRHATRRLQGTTWPCGPQATLELFTARIALMIPAKSRGK